MDHRDFPPQFRNLNSFLVLGVTNRAASVNGDEFTLPGFSICTGVPMGIVYVAKGKTTHEGFANRSALEIGFY